MSKKYMITKVPYNGKYEEKVGDIFKEKDVTWELGDNEVYITNIVDNGRSMEINKKTCSCKCGCGIELAPLSPAIKIMLGEENV